ncbi:MAG: ABC transporter ATP-binding protein [Methanobacterium sp.]|nr:ABC transporter ATP-binding protein [Methanobacterium sp.]
MRILKSKDLMLIFLVSSIYILIISYPHLNFNKSTLEVTFLILSFVFVGYPLIAFLRPEEDYIKILKKPVLLLELSLLFILSISLILKFSLIGQNMRILTLFLSIIAMIFTLIAYINRIRYFKLIKSENETVSTTEKSVPKTVHGKTVIKVDNVGMQFRLSEEKVDNLKEYVIKFLKRQISYNEFWAVRGISFEVEKGDRWGIIGLNGAGKSTLLKIISGVMKPTEGNVEIKGKIIPLLELGAGFDTNYTGKENIFLNGAMLGLSKEFLEEKYEEIVEFSEIRKFINVPLKNYSSGMRARLGFSIATTIKPEILILDEVLSVGDAKFRKKSEKKITSLFKEGVTVLFVSHSIIQVKKICNKAIWLEKGKIVMVGDAKEVCESYAENM